jgi:hypothetical protein
MNKSLFNSQGVNKSSQPYLLLESKDFLEYVTTPCVIMGPLALG